MRFDLSRDFLYKLRSSSAVLMWHLHPIYSEDQTERGDGRMSIVHFQKLSTLHSPPPLAHRYVFNFDFFNALSRRRSRMMSVSVETLWGRKGAAAEEKGSNDPVTFDTLLQMQNGYSSRNLTKRASFDGKWYRQWPVAGSVGCLSASREAYQMTLKISSTTIKFEGGTEWGAVAHIRWACKCAWWQDLWGGKKPLFNDFFVSIVVIVGTLIIAPPTPQNRTEYIHRKVQTFEIAPGVAHLQFKLMHFLDS